MRLFILCFIVLCLIVYNRSTSQKQFKLDSITRNEQNRLVQVDPFSQHQIFVLIIGGDTVIAEQLIQQSYLPQRIFIGLVNTYVKPKFNNNHIRYYQIPHPLQLGRSCWRYLGLKQLYQQEEYILLLDANSTITLHWDRILLQQLLLHAYPRGAHIITQPRAGILGFPVVHKLNNQGIPLFKIQPYTLEGHMNQTLYIRSLCTFASARIILSLHTHGIAYLTSIEDEFFLSGLTWILGYITVTVSTLIITKPLLNNHVKFINDIDSEATQILHKIKDSLMQAFLNNEDCEKVNNQVPDVWNYIRTHQLNSFQIWFETLGIDPLKKLVSGRAYLGLLKNWTSHEIIQKYGSEENFHKWRQTYCID